MKLVTVSSKEAQVLRQVASPVTNETPAYLAELSVAMRRTMLRHNGIGIAAPQVGVSLRVLLAKLSDGEVLMLNPEIVTRGRTCSIASEGCLSVPHRRIPKQRHEYIEVTYKTLAGDRREVYIGMDARIIQHEIDHLDGKLILDD